MHTLILYTVTVSMYKTVNEPFQQHTAVSYQDGYDDLRRTPVSNKLSSNSILQNSDALSEAKCSLSLWLSFA